MDEDREREGTKGVSERDKSIDVMEREGTIIKPFNFTWKWKRTLLGHLNIVIWKFIFVTYGVKYN